MQIRVERGKRHGDSILIVEGLPKKWVPKYREINMIINRLYAIELINQTQRFNQTSIKDFLIRKKSKKSKKS